ncbi:MAG: c-type cytochrome [Candidatus Acidiferrales bacterium]
MRKQLTAVAMFAFFAVSSPAQETKTSQGQAPEEQKVPPEIVNRKNPVPPSAASIAEGKKLFTIDCVMCHGQEGDGKGDLAVSMKLSPPDYHDETAMKKFTDGELFYIITNGKGGMPAEGKRATPDQIWSLVNYVRSFAQKKPLPATTNP